MKKTDLYGLTLEEFTRERDALVRDLRGAGRKKAAAEIQALRKPSVSAWAVNQAVRRRPQDAKALVKAGTQLRKAQRDAVSGRNPSGMKKATRAQRGLVEALTDAAREALEGRRAVSPAVLARVAQTLRAASVDKEASKLLLAGTLVADVEQTGFGPLLSAVPGGAARTRPAREPKPKPKAKPPPKPKPDPNVARRAKLQQELEKAQARVRELEERLEHLSGG